MRNEQYACDAMAVNFMEADVGEGLYGLIKTKEIWDALHELYIDKNAQQEGCHSCSLSSSRVVEFATLSSY